MGLLLFFDLTREQVFFADKQRLLTADCGKVDRQQDASLPASLASNVGVCPDSAAGRLLVLLN